MVVCSSMESEPQLPRFFAGRDVFITGATGFMGKVLVERLLSTCPDIGRLHLLMRDKRGQPPQKRLAQLKQSQVFECLRARAPRQLDKIVCCVGDVTLPRLGLDALAVQQLKEVSVIFHNAATVRFSEGLAEAVANNVTSVLHLLDLCDLLQNLEVLVHVSTAMVNCELPYIEERVYSAPAELRHVTALIQALPKDILQEVTPRYVYPKPNTYVFTKALAEVEVQRRSHRNYSVAIFRPSIVVSSDRYPFPGWVEGLSGATGVVVGTAQGVLRAFPLRYDSRADLVPVDVVIDDMLAVAWETGVDRRPDVRVYHCSSMEHAVSWRAFHARVMRVVLLTPLDHVCYYPFAYGIDNRFHYKLVEVLFQTVPCYVAEYVLKMCRVKTPISLSKAADRIRSMSCALRFFSCQEFHFQVDNMRRLVDRLRDTDGRLYHLDVKNVDWDKHAENFMIGARRYVMKQKDERLPAARAHVRRLYYIHCGVKLFLAFFCYKLVRSLAPAALKMSKLLYNKSLQQRFAKRIQSQFLVNFV